MNQLNSEYDVVVIGSGLAGLTGANQLAKWGQRVLLLEQQPNLGGLAAWFHRRGGHIFDVSLHGFPFGMKKSCRKYWNQKITDSIIQLTRVRLENPQFSIESTFELGDLARLLSGHFRVPPETVDRFFRRLKEMEFYSESSQTTRELLEECFPGRSDVHRLLMEPITYANGSTPEDPAITFGIVFSNFLNRGVYTFQGGTDNLIREMRLELERNGAHVQTRSRAEKFMVKQGKIAGITVGGQEIRCRAILSNANLLNTIFNLAGEEHFSSAYLDLARSVRMSGSSCQVYLGIRKGEKVPDIGDLLFTSTLPHYDPAALSAKEVTSQSFSFYSPKIRPGHDRYAIVASSNARWEDWAGLSEEEYQSDKQKLIAKTIANLEKYLPGITDQIDHREAATPRTFARYTGHRQGASFGTKFEGLKVSQDISREIGGLFHTGSVGIIMSGWLGTVNYGVIAAHSLEVYLGSPSRGSQGGINEV